jgi:hypothetical protein
VPDSRQTIEPPTDVDVEAIARALLHAEEVAREVLGEALDGSVSDLERLQRVLDRGFVSRESTFSLQALGMAFGKVFVNAHAGYDWWMVEDEYGRDPAIRWRDTSLLVFPRTMLSKRIEDGEAVDVVDLYAQLEARLEQLIEDSYR